MPRPASVFDTLPFSVAICKAAGVDPDTVQRIEITIDAAEPVTMRISRFVPVNEAEGWERLIQDYVLEPKPGSTVHVRLPADSQSDAPAEVQPHD